MKALTICISTHEMGGKGPGFLKFSLDKIAAQTFKDFNVVISDQSTDDGIKRVCDEYARILDLKYVKEPTGVRGSSVNINNAIRHATGKVIKIIFLDDYLYHDRALEEIMNAFDPEHDNWMVTASIHTQDGVKYYRPFYPKYDDNTILMRNSISSPSVLVLKNDKSGKDTGPVLFDEKLIWWMDLDYYKRCYDRFGAPKILNTIEVVNREGMHQVTNTTANERRREDEFVYIVKKFNLSNPRMRIFSYRAKRYWKQLKQLVKKIIRHKKA